MSIRQILLERKKQLLRWNVRTGWAEATQALHVAEVTKERGRETFLGFLPENQTDCYLPFSLPTCKRLGQTTVLNIIQTEM